MAKTDPFDRYSDRYEAWFERHTAAYQSELDAVRRLWPAKVAGIEIGVGAGHFAAPLGIEVGVEPSAVMRTAAVRRGVHAIGGTAEHLPFPAKRFDAALMVTTICFVNDPARCIREMYRVLRPGGYAVIGFVDRESALGREYESNRESSVFYSEARFFSVSELVSLLTGVGFTDFEYCQTVFTHPGKMRVPDTVREGFGGGSFVVVRSRKPETSEC